MTSPTAEAAAALPLEPPRPAHAAPLPPTRPLYWSLRRELWENRSIYLGPLAVAAVVLGGLLLALVRLPAHLPAWSALAPPEQHAAFQRPFYAEAGTILLTVFLVGCFFCLDALHADRRDRSVLFWKSLPVADSTTVLAKALVPLAVLPLVALVLIAAAEATLFAASTAALLPHRASVEMLWANVPLLRMWLAMLYALVAITLWHAPIYAWLLLVSAWARRATFLWAALPPLAIAAFERVTFGTSHVGAFLSYRVLGWMSRGFVPRARYTAPLDPLTTLDPGTFLATPGLWIGLAFAVAFLAGAVRLRRLGGPL